MSWPGTTTPTVDLLVIGGASLDVLHLTGGQTVSTAGGAGLYTALAAHSAGVRAGMFAPRAEPMPPQLQPAADRLSWFGPTCSADDLPHFEIAHYGAGRAALVNAVWGSEISLTPDMLPGDLLGARIVHVAALRNTDRQFGFAQTCQSKGARVSAGTYGHVCADEPDRVRALIDLSDFFFMNENEATLLFGSVEAARTKPDHILFVTLSARGALVIQGEHVTHVPGLHADEIDPTGAGDTFCGATLAGLLRGEHPVMAARSAVALAAEMIGAIGPARLLGDRPAPSYPIDPRARPVPDQIRRVAELIKHLPEVKAFDFTGDLFPPIDQPHALDFFFAATLQQFSFWETKPLNREDATLHKTAGQANAENNLLRLYDRPMIATLDGQSLKGSDYLWAAYLRTLQPDPEFCSPARQAALTADELASIFRADDGSNPMPAFELHLQMANAYGRDMLALNWTPADLLRIANETSQPRQTFLSLLDHVSGYKEDPLRKKSMLLALILEQRPESFLRPSTSLRSAQDAEPPVIDYHLMRSCLRIGLVEIHDDDLKRRVIAREELTTDEEWIIRLAAYEAIQQVQQSSGRSMGAVDLFFFGARRRCPEMTEPDCPNCPVDPVCAHRKELFQPILRTTYY
jgi:sugar/nucleoside kinase (ribokinase family)